MKCCWTNYISLTIIEPERPNQNPEEGVIRELLRRWFLNMIWNTAPRKLWDYGVQWTTQVMQRNPTQADMLRGIWPLQDVTGETPEILEYLDFGLYDHVSYKENAGFGMTSIGRWIGLYHRVGILMSYWILTQKGRVVSRTTDQHITILEKETEKINASVTNPWFC